MTTNMTDMTTVPVLASVAGTALLKKRLKDACKQIPPTANALGVLDNATVEHWSGVRPGPCHFVLPVCPPGLSSGPGFGQVRVTLSSRFVLPASPPVLSSRLVLPVCSPGLSSRLALLACPPDLCLSSRDPFGGSLRGGFAGGGVWVCPLGSPTHPSANPPLSHL